MNQLRETERNLKKTCFAVKKMIGGPEFSTTELIPNRPYNLELYAGIPFLGKVNLKGRKPPCTVIFDRPDVSMYGSFIHKEPNSSRSDMFHSGKTSIRVFPNNDRRASDWYGYDWFYMSIEADCKL